MRESNFGFQYSWSDTRPIRPLVWVVIAAQLLGSVLGYLELTAPSAFDRIWIGGAISSLPGYLAGCVAQWLLRPGGLAEERVMVRRFGLVATLISVIAAIKYWLNEG